MAESGLPCGDGAACSCAVDVSAPPVPNRQPWEAGRLKRVREGVHARRRGGPTSPSALLLDMGGVVIPTLFESVSVPGFPGGPFDGEEAYATVERGERQEREYWADFMAKRPDLDLGELWRVCSRVRPQLAGVLPRLASVVRVVAFTNDMAHWFGDSWPRSFPELALFDTVIEAAKIGPLKPAVAAFELAAQAIGLQPDACLFVDDLAANLRGAERAGMQTMLFDVTDPVASIGEVCATFGIDARDPGPSLRVFATPRSVTAR